MPEVDCFARSETPINIGSSMTTMGVLFKNALNEAPSTSVARNHREGLFAHIHASRAASGRSASVVSIPLPTIISAQIVTSAS